MRKELGHSTVVIFKDNTRREAMIKDPHSMVKDFNTRQMVKRHSVTVLAKKCAGCGTLTNHYDHYFGWHVCVDCDSDEIAGDIADHVMNPNRGMTGIW